MTFIYNRKTNRLESARLKKNTNIKHKVFIGIIFLFAVGISLNVFSKNKEISINEVEGKIKQENQEVVLSEIIPESVLSENVESYKISEGDIPAEIFSKYGKMNANDMATFLASAENVHDFTNLKIGRDIRFYFSDEERAHKIEYEKNTEEIIIAQREGDKFSVREEKINYEISQEIAKGEIDNFFYVDALEAGLSEPTVLEVGDLFSFSIDFSTEIRQGDKFAFVYEKRKRGGEDAPDGRILAAKFINDGNTHYAYYFNPEESEGGLSRNASHSDAGAYYDGEGRVLERQFLRAPLSYRSITSGYSGARLHPITRTVTAHYQIDYAAPTGTPVSSTARGTVVSAGWEDGWGYIVRIRHDNGYTTHYGHLSAFAKEIKAGSSVAQGQILGYVGSTGWSTGPHLDYGMKLNGKPINPLKLELPKGTSLDDEKMIIFNEKKNKYSKVLE